MKEEGTCKDNSEECFFKKIDHFDEVLSYYELVYDIMTKELEINCFCFIFEFLILSKLIVFFNIIRPYSN